MVPWVVFNLLYSCDVIVVSPQLLLVAQAVIPVAQIFISGKRKRKCEGSSDRKAPKQTLQQYSNIHIGMFCCHFEEIAKDP